MSATSFVLPRQVKTNVTGIPYAGAKAFFYQTGTQTLQTVYQDIGLTVEHDSPVLANDDGYWPVIWLDANAIANYQVRILSANDVELDNIPDVPRGVTRTNLGLDQTFLSQILNPLTDAEQALGITADQVNFEYLPGNVLRYNADPTGALDSTAAFNLATFASQSPIVAPGAYKTVHVPAGKYVITDTVYIPTGTILHGDGMSSYIDASSGFAAGTKNVFRLGWSLVAGVPTKGTIYLTGGFPPEIYGLFVNGGPGTASVVEMNFPGCLCHDMWFGGPGQAVYLAGGYLYDCEIDAGLTGITIGPGINQTVDNVRFFNQNVAINFDTTTGDISNCIFTSCTIEYPKVVGIQLGSGTVSCKGIKFVGCDFPNNPGSSVTSFTALASVGLANAQLEFNSCTFRNWGRFSGPSPTPAVLVSASGAIVDVKGCLFDGSISNPNYTASTTALALQLTQGTLRVTDSQFRHLPFGGGVLIYNGTTQCVCEMDGVMYSDLLSTTAVNVSNSNAASTFFASNVKGDGVTPFLNAQSTVQYQLKNMTRWFSAIGTSGGSNFVTFPYQASGIYAITLTANQNVGGSGSYRKSRLDYVEKDNDFSTSAKSFLNFATIVQGANNTGGSGNATLTLNVEFGAVGGTTSIASSNSGVLAVSWPSGYTSVSIDIQVIQSG